MSWPCKKCGKLHGMVIENKLNGTSEPIDVCYDCLFEGCKYRQPCEIVFETIQNSIGDIMEKLKSAEDKIISELLPTTPIKWHRVRFKTNFEDSRPVIFPPPGPWWESGYAADESYAIAIAYFPTHMIITLKQYWPDAEDLDWHRIDDKPVFTDRFQCPSWWDEEKMEAKKEYAN